MPNIHQLHIFQTRHQLRTVKEPRSPKTLSKATVTQKIKQMKNKNGRKKGYYLSQYLPPRALFPLPLA